MSRKRKPSPVLTDIMSKITDEDREKTRMEMLKEIGDCENSRDRNTTHYYISNRNKIKITEDIIKEIFIDKLNWQDDVFEFTEALGLTDDGEKIIKHYYTSPCKRYLLTYDKHSNISDENGDGWNLHIDNSDMNSIGNVSVNYVQEILQIIEIFKDY